MKIDLKKIINIKNMKELKNFQLDKPIFHNNYLFHYLISLKNFVGLKLAKFPVYIENDDGMNAFHLAAKEYDFDILCHLIDKYPEYIYNKNRYGETFTCYLPFEEFNSLMKKYPDVDWYSLIEFSKKNNDYVLKNIFLNLNYKDLNEFIKLYKIKPGFRRQYLYSVLFNNVLKTNDKIKLLGECSQEEINVKGANGIGLIITAMEISDEKIFDYLLERNIDIDYYGFINSYNPLITGLYYDIFLNKYNYGKKILDKLVKINPLFYRTRDRYLDNIAHAVLFIRIKKNNTSQNAIDIKNINFSPELEILKLCDNETLNEFNFENMSPIELLTSMNYDIYSRILIDKNVAIAQDIYDIIKNSDSDKRWIKLLESLPKYERAVNDVIIETHTYSHSTLFQAKFKDVGIYSLYLNDAYPELYLPNMTSYMINNLTFEDSFPFSDDIIKKEPVFPWIISYYSDSEYYIHPYLNNLINTERRKGKCRFAVVFISLISDNSLHAGMLIYDFKNMTIERFEPYGNTMYIDDLIDEVLEEELTWNTGLKYL